MKKNIFIMSFLLLCGILLYAEELTGFFGFNLGDSFEKFSKDEIFEICTKSKSASFPRKDISIEDALKICGVDYKTYELSLTNDYDYLGKHRKYYKLKENGTTKKIELYPEINNEKNDKRIALRNRFKFAGLYVQEISFVFINDELVCINLAGFNETFKFERFDKKEGYLFYNSVYYDNGGFLKLGNSNRLKGFNIIREAMSEKYNLVFQEVLEKNLNKQYARAEHKTMYYYIPQENQDQAIYFTYIYSNIGEIYGEQITIINENLISNAIVEQTLNKIKENTKEQQERKQSIFDEI